MNRRRVAASFLSAAVVLCWGVACGAQAYTQIVVFGDSLSDTGNFARLTTNAYGPALRVPGPVADYTDGRFTDGTLTVPPALAFNGIWLEQMAGTFAAHPVVTASLDGGNDYAYGSATTAAGSQVVTYGAGSLSFTVTVQNVGAQIAAYLATNPAITNRTLFVVWGGANDILRGPTPTQIATAAGQDVANVQALIAAGATDFLIPNLPPLGAIPRLNGMAAVAAQATAASAAYNATLAAQLGTLPAANPGKTLHVYALDVFSLFNSALAAPGVFGFMNVTQSAQGQVLAVADQYLFWDDLHPTTFGHYLISRLAESVLTQTATATTSLTLGAANALQGQTISLKSVVAASAGATTPTPTGLVTFYSGGVAVTAAMLDSTGTATASLVAGPASGSPYAITARYSGDGVYYANASGAQNVTVLAPPVTTTTTLASSSGSVNLGSAVTLTATVTSPVGPPTGMVTFMDGAALLGTATLTAGTASSTAMYAAAALGAGPHSVTAVYGAGATYAGSSSAAISVVVTAPAYTFTASPTALTIPSGSSGSTTLTVTPVGGLTGTYTLACGTLPAHFSCSFATTNFVLAGGAAQSTQLTIGTNVATAGLAMPARPGERDRSPVFAAFALLPCLGGLALASGRRRKLRSMGLTLGMLALLAGAMFGASGCSSNSPNAPAGTYQVPVNLTPSGSGGSSASLSIMVTVQ